MTVDNLFEGMSNVPLEHPIHHLEERLRLIKSMADLVHKLPLENAQFTTNDVSEMIRQFEVAIHVLKSI